MGVDGLNLRWDKERAFQSDVIFIFLFKFLFTLSWRVKLKHEKCCCANRLRFSHSVCECGSMFNQFFTLLSRPGKAERTICLFKMLRWGFFPQYLLWTIVGGEGAEIFVESWVKFELEQVEPTHVEARSAIKKVFQSTDTNLSFFPLPHFLYNPASKITFEHTQTHTWSC